MAEFQTGLEGLTLIPGRTGSFEVTLDDDVDEVSPIGHVQLTLGTFHLHIRPLNGNVDTLGNGNGLLAYT